MSSADPEGDGGPTAISAAEATKIRELQGYGPDAERERWAERPVPNPRPPRCLVCLEARPIAGRGLCGECCRRAPRCGVTGCTERISHANDFAGPECIYGTPVRGVWCWRHRSERREGCPGRFWILLDAPADPDPLPED
jgi:hypothetical protein